MDMKERFNNPNNNSERLSAKQKLGRVMAMAALIATGVGTVEAANWANTPTFSNATHTITVKEGDTVWGLANSIEGGDNLANKQAAVDKIREDNGNMDLNLKPGEKVTVPDAVSANQFDRTAQEADTASQANSTENTES